MEGSVESEKLLEVPAEFRTYNPRGWINCQDLVFMPEFVEDSAWNGVDGGLDDPSCSDIPT